jgi:hypothetical protein
MSKSWVLNVQEDSNGDCFLVFNEEMFEQSGFKIGDVLSWVNNKDGSFTLTKKETPSK